VLNLSTVLKLVIRRYPSVYSDNLYIYLLSLLYYSLQYADILPMYSNNLYIYLLSLLYYSLQCADIVPVYRNTSVFYISTVVEIYVQYTKM
jgi:hypothetical protein